MVQEVLSIENVIKDTFLLFKNSFKRLAISLLIFLIPMAILGGVTIPKLVLLGDMADWEDILVSNLPIIIMLGLYIFVALPVYLLYSLRSVYNTEVGIEESNSTLFSKGFKKVFPFWGLYILLVLIALVCFIPMAVSIAIEVTPLIIVTAIAGYVGFFILIIALSCIFILQLVEDKSIIDSLKGSWELTKNRRGRLFLIYIVVSIVFSTIVYIAMFIIMSVGGVILYLGGHDILGGMESMSGSIIYTIIMSAVSILIYPFYFAFYMSVFINLKRDKGKLFATNIVDDFMKEDKEEGVDDNWQ